MMNKNFKLFKKYIKYYHNLLDINNWNIECVFEENKESDHYATCFVSLQDKMVTYTYVETSIELQPLDIKKIALHEVLHCLLWKLQELAESRYIQEKDIPETTHSIIKILENLIISKTKK